MTLKHLHIYKRADIGRKEFNKDTKKWKKISHIVYKCIKPGCTHHVSPELVLDRQAECCRCNTQFIVTRRCLNAGRIVNIHCEDCFQDKELSGALELIKELNLE